MRELVGVVFVMVTMAACGGGGAKPAATPVPENSAPADCASTAAVITRVLAADDADAKAEQPKVNADVTKRCSDDKWTADARTCLMSANTSEALTKCGYENLTQQQQDKLNAATAPMSGTSTARVMKVMVGFKDQLCACKDAACVEKVSDAMTKWSMEMSKKEIPPPKMTEADTKQAAAIGEEMGKCMQAAMSASLPPAAPLSVTGVDPPNGDVTGGTYVKISGESFTNGGARNAKVYFGAKQGTVVRFASDTELIVEAPAGKANETVDVKVVFDPGGEMTLPKAFTFGKPKKKKK
jgi:hypothetical protein